MKKSIMKDHRKNFSFAIAMMIILMFVSCTPEAMFDGIFTLQISVINQSDAELVIERHDVSGDFVVKKTFQFLKMSRVCTWVNIMVIKMSTPLMM